MTYELFKEQFDLIVPLSLAPELTSGREVPTECGDGLRECRKMLLMTGGQYSPTTPRHEFGTTAPYGNIDRPFDIAGLAFGAGASYAARGSAYHVTETISLIQEGIRHKGFSIIDVASICPTYYGRKNHKGDAVQMLEWQRDHAVTQEKAFHMGHAGAIIQGSAGTAEGKIAALRAAGVTVADTPDRIGEALIEAVRKAGVYDACRSE